MIECTQWAKCFTCGSIPYNSHSTMQEILFPIVSLCRQCPDILNMLSPVVSMVLLQYLHAFLSPKATKEEIKEIEGEKVNSFLH